MKSAAMVALLLLFAAVPLAAQERNVQLSVFLSRADVTGENEFVDSFFDTHFDEGSGYGLSANMFFGDRVSAEAAAFTARSDASLGFDDTSISLGNLNMTAFTLGGQFHILGKRRIDPYVGAGAAYVIGDDFFNEDLEAGGIGRIELDNEFTYYLNAGFGVQLTEGFGLALDARHIPYEPNTRSTVTGVEQDLDLTTMIYSVGLRLRF